MDLMLDRAGARLFDGRGGMFDPATRRWAAAAMPAAAEPLPAEAAIRWLQRESGAPHRVPVAVIGPRAPTPRQAEIAFAIGARLGTAGLTVLCGGRGGVMEAVCRGVAAAGGLSIGLLPDGEPEAANPYVTVPIATGIGVARNALIARGCCCAVAIGGGNGTLSEIAFALQFGRPVFVLEGAPAVPGVVTCTDAEEALRRVFATVLGLPGEAG